MLEKYKLEDSNANLSHLNRALAKGRSWQADLSLSPLFCFGRKGDFMIEEEQSIRIRNDTDIFILSFISSSYSLSSPPCSLLPTTFPPPTLFIIVYLIPKQAAKMGHSNSQRVPPVKSS